MRYPDFLQTNGTIGFVAPSFGCATEPYKTAFLHAQELWKKEGYKLELGPNCYAQEGVGISNTPEKCGRELTEWYCHDTNDCLISCGGGELMCEILDYVDFDAIQKAAPKWYMGFSDNTNMTFLLTTLCDTASIYGPCAASFGMEPRHCAVDDAMSLLRGKKLTMTGYDMWERESLKDEENPLQSYNLTELSKITYVMPDGRTNIEGFMRQGISGAEDGQTALKQIDSVNKPEISFSGRLLGGCMDCLVNLTGTQYDNVGAFVEKYKDDGILWFLEACDLNLMSIRRAMWQMDHAGWFKHCSGFLIGRPRIGMGEDEFGINRYEAAYEMLRKYNVPVIMDVDIGHLPPMMPLICGSIGHVKSDGETYSVTMELK
jgi:muramoyltetrapeptide carboxypeptidase LdcA involved in peptidoglycan recycling